MSTEVHMSTRSSNDASAAVELPEDGSRDAPGPPEPSKARRVAFRVLAILVSLQFLLFFSFALAELVLMWLPGETLSSMFEDVAEIVSHRSHFLSVGIVAWTVVPAMLVQLRKPERRVAPMLVLVAAALGGSVVYGLSGTATEWLQEELVLLVPVMLLALLHPRSRDLFRKPQWSGRMLAAASLAAAPWIVYIFENGRRQLLNVAGDPHAEMEHWATAALMAFLLVVSSFLGSSDHAGWRLPAWIAAAGTVIFGVHSLVFPGLASGLSSLWAGAAVLWGVALAILIVTRSREERLRPEPRV